MARRIAYTGKPVLTLEQVAHQCRLELDDLQQELIEQVIIPGVTSQAEARSGAAVRAGIYEEIWAAEKQSGVALDVGQANELISVSQVLADGTSSVLQVHAVVRNQGKESCLYFPEGRPAGELSVRYNAGTDLQIYPGVAAWMLMHAATAHEFRETLVSGTILARLPESFLDALLAEITVPPRF
jgi:hypothetical protein